jgi:hypothetical protein
LNAALSAWWKNLRGLLPYPDAPRRWRMRRMAARLVTCQKWPGDDATGPEAAQLALYRLLWLQQRTRRAVMGRRRDEAALLARASLETCILGLYCLFSSEAVAQLSAANYRAAKRVISYISDDGLVSKEAIDSAARALGELGPDLNIKDVAFRLGQEHGLSFVPQLYSAYYVPLSHFFVHANAFTLMRHVRPDGTLHRRPDFPWARRTAVRMADACTGLLAGNLDGKAGSPLIRYAEAHLARLVTPAMAMTVRGALRGTGWRKLPGVIRQVAGLRRYTHGPGLADNPAERDARLRQVITTVLGALVPDAPEGMFNRAIDEYVTMVADDMNRVAAGSPPGTIET